MSGLVLDEYSIFQNGTPIANLTLTVARGQVLTIMAPSGAGKSTLLLGLIGALPEGFTRSGRILLAGRDVTDLPTPRRRIGLIFQDDLLFPHLSVGQNLAFGLAPGGSRSERRNKVEAALASAGLQGFADRDPATLSGGERSRVALLRALLAQPQALLLDEPFARLDAGLRDQIRQTTFQACKDLPVILVTHDAQDAAAAAGPVISLFGDPVRV